MLWRKHYCIYNEKYQVDWPARKIIGTGGPFANIFGKILNFSRIPFFPIWNWVCMNEMVKLQVYSFVFWRLSTQNRTQPQNSIAVCRKFEEHPKQNKLMKCRSMFVSNSDTLTFLNFLYLFLQSWAANLLYLLDYSSLISDLWHTGDGKIDLFLYTGTATCCDFNTHVHIVPITPLCVVTKFVTIQGY